MPSFPTLDELFQTIQTLVMLHSPSGVETEMDDFLLARFRSLGIDHWIDDAGNAIAKIPGKDSSRCIAITAHKDEIGGMVTTVHGNGRVEVRRLGGAYPWVYGEGVVDLIGDHQTISGILSFGSRHVPHESPRRALQEDKVLTWEHAWIETKCTKDDLNAAGIRPGTRMVIGKHRKVPFRIKDHIASYTLDNKASVAILLALAEQLSTSENTPTVDVYLVASSKEEVGAIGALYFTQRQPINALIALEICPLSPDYPIEDGVAPVLLAQDNYGLYDEGLNADIRRAAQTHNLPLQLAVLGGFGSDASIAMKFGHVPRGACLSFPTENTHGYEIAHLGAIANCISILHSYCITA